MSVDRQSQEPSSHAVVSRLWEGELQSIAESYCLHYLGVIQPSVRKWMVHRQASLPAREVTPKFLETYPLPSLSSATER